MTATFYRVTITNPSLTGTANGFIDHTSVERYLASVSIPGDFDLAKSQAKERGNMRYADVVGTIQMMANGYISNWTATDAAVDAEASAFAFTVTVERGDDALVTRNEAGGLLSGAAALKRAVARALIRGYTRNTLVFDPTETAAPGNTTEIRRNAGRTALLQVGALAADLTAAEALVTVTKIANIG